MTDEILSSMDRDIGSSAAYRTAERFLSSALAAGSGDIFDLSDLAISPDGRRLAATGATIAKLEGLPQQRICVVELETGALSLLTDGTHRDRLPRWSPDGRRIAYLSDVSKPYDFQLRILTLGDGSVIDVPIPGRWVESVQWSGDGRRILLLAAGLGADLAGAQGAISAPVADAKDLDWAPLIDQGVAEAQWRSLWIHDVGSQECRQVSRPDMNVWEGCWCGPDRVACVASDGPSEDDWYGADVRLIELATGEDRQLYQPGDQVGAISASPSGARVAFVEAVCSDRMLVAGTLMAGKTDEVRAVDTGQVDVTFTSWQGDDTLMFAGMRGFETVLGVSGFEKSPSRELWASDVRTFGNPLFPDAASGVAPGSAVMMAESYLEPPRLIVLAEGAPEREISFGRPILPEDIAADAVCERVSWRAHDDREIQGWLVRPSRSPRQPVIMQIHGGPVWRARPRYVGRGLNGLLLQSGYALFQPNPRGSSGQGQEYARAVLGDVGGADAKDLLHGLDHLVAAGIADPGRIGVTGGSYGGFMTAWLVTRDERFAAAVAIAPVSDWISAKLTSHVGRSIEMMMGGQALGPDTLYHHRSPAFDASRATTPTLIVSGALDRSTPPVQGQELHHALAAAGTKSVLLTYPGEGHGVRQFPAVIDFTARTLAWFRFHMSNRPEDF